MELTEARQALFGGFIPAPWKFEICPNKLKDFHTHTHTTIAKNERKYKLNYGTSLIQHAAEQAW